MLSSLREGELQISSRQMYLFQRDFKNSCCLSYKLFELVRWVTRSLIIVLTVSKPTPMARFYLTSILILSISSVYAQTYVSFSGSGSMNGSSWANAYPANQLQEAIDNAPIGTQVWVATGLYRTTSSTTRTESFHMRNGVVIYGSFAGTETSLAQRDLSKGLTTTLTGEIGAAGISDNSYHVIENTGLNNSAILDGFIITGANDDRAATENQGLGGGIYNNGTGNVCSPTIRNCVIINNRAEFGAGIFNSGYLGGVSSPVITNCVIAFNTATSGGGGIDNFGLAGNASPTITNTIFYENTAAFRAGAMYCWGGNNGNASPVVINSVFVNNSAVDAGCVVADRLNSGGGSSGNSDPSFKNCIFQNNEASGTGPQFYLLGGATFNITYSAIDLTGQTGTHVITGGVGNISANPFFVNISSGIGDDNVWLTNDDGLRLQATSPCIDAGNNTGTPATDILSTPRILNTTVDMGAYERSTTITLLEEESKSDEPLFYPNPASDFIQFANVKSGTKMNIFSLQGLLIESKSIDNTQFSVSTLKDGAYVIQFISGSNRTTRKLMVSR